RQRGESAGGDGAHADAHVDSSPHERVLDQTAHVGLEGADRSRKLEGDVQVAVIDRLTLGRKGQERTCSLGPTVPRLATAHGCLGLRRFQGCDVLPSMQNNVKSLCGQCVRTNSARVIAEDNALTVGEPGSLEMFQGARSVDADLIHSARFLGASERQIMSTVVVPSALAWTCASLTPSISFALIGVVVGEFIGGESGGGLGYLIVQSLGTLNAADMMVALLMLGVIGIVMALGIKQLEARLLRWRPEFQKR